MEYNISIQEFVWLKYLYNNQIKKLLHEFDGIVIINHLSGISRARIEIK